MSLGFYQWTLHYVPKDFNLQLCIFTEACTMAVCFADKSADLLCGGILLPIPAR
jgi:hypothetical protein